MDKLPSETFCVLPWMHAYVDQSGVMSACCEARQTNRDAGGRELRIHELSSLDEAWNSASMTQLRRDMLVGNRNPACATCYLHEDAGMASMRESVNKTYAARYARYYENASPDGRAEETVHKWHMALGNLCNLRCRMCYPLASKALIPEFKEILGLPEEHPLIREARRIDWYQRPEFWSRFDEYTQQTNRIHFGGGEPLLNNDMFDYLERLVSQGRASEIKLSYNTNVTVLPKRIFDLWPKFNEVRIQASIDGYDEINSLIRNPSDWKVFDRNLRFLDEHAEELNCTSLSFHSTIQIYNVFDLGRLFEYTMYEFRRFKPYPAITLVVMPPWLSVQVLPQELKELAAERLRAIPARFAGRWPERGRDDQRDAFISSVEGIAGHMLSADQSSLLPRFVQVSGGHDAFRGESVPRVVPELAPLFATAAGVAG